MTDSQKDKIPSLLDREATGGETAERGLTSQEAVLLAHLPVWLAEEGFTALIRESLSDIEAQFFVPGIGFQKEFIEAKDHSVAPAEFKQELRRFQQMAAASPATFRWFTLACPGLSETLKPLSNGLRHLRNPFPFYAADAGVQETSYIDFERIVLGLDTEYTHEDARFLFEKVAIKEEYGHAISGEALFRQGLLESLPDYNELSQSLVTTIFDTLNRLLKSQLRKPISRRQIETTMLSMIPERMRPMPSPVVLWTLSELDTGGSGFRFAWERFFGGSQRQYPNTDEWVSGIITPLRELRWWVEQNRLTRRVRLEGSRRLSTSIAIGATLPAVSGFVIEMNHRGKVWATDAYSKETYPLTVDWSAGVGDDLVVILDVIKTIQDEVRIALPSLNLLGTSILALHSVSPVDSPEEANNLVARVKVEIHSALVRSKSQKIHLFYAGPSHVALFLGHRLNATAPVQCYEWVASGVYVPTCLLK